MKPEDKERVEALYKSCALGIFGKQFSCTLCKETVEHDDCDDCPIFLTMEEYNRNAKILISPDKPKEFAIATCISKEDLYDDAYSNGMSEGLKIGRESCSQMVEQFLEETFSDGDLIPPLLIPQLIDKWNKFIKERL